MTAIYFAADFLLYAVKGNIDLYLQKVFTVQSLINLLLWNDPVVADHSWYMWAMVYTLLIAYFAPSIYRNKYARFTLICGGILSQLIFGKYSLLIFGTDIASIYTRDAWSVTIPYFLIGTWLRENIEKAEKIRYLNVIWFLSAIGCVAERTLLVNMGLNGTRDSYIFLAPLAILTFVCLYNSERLKNENLVAECGRKYSLMLYIIHPLFVRVEMKVFDMDSGWKYVGFISVLLISFLCTVVADKGKTFIGNKKTYTL